MAKFGYPKLTIELDKTEGGALEDISNYVTSINGYEVEAILQDITGAGLTDDAWAYVGFLQKSPIVLSGPYDNTADKLVAATMDKEGETRTLKLTFDTGVDADTRQVETIINKTGRFPERGKFHEYVLTLRPTGAVT